jgi:tRNA threonylcarbamoyl adenosine modification protein (Sua5/YciO/YrdC/YwlC family)
MPSRFLEIHPGDPQPRLIRQAVEIIREGGVVVYPTDSCYALGCHIGDKAAMERIARIRQTDKHHHFTLVCSDLSEIARYARVSNQQYRTLKAFTPGPYTFILQATRQTPKRLQNTRRRTIGIRVPDHPVPRAILSTLAEPLMSSTLLLPGDDLPLTDAKEIQERLYHVVDAVIDGGNCGLEPTSVIDLEVPRP